MTTSLPGYQEWAECCDTLHAMTQLLGKLCVALAPPEPQLQHAALRLTARGWETPPLPAPDGSGAFVVALDLRAHQAIVEHAAGGSRQTDLARRPVADVTGEILAAVTALAGAARIDPRPQEVGWTAPLDADEEHRHYEPEQVGTYFAAATAAALALAEYAAPFRGRRTPVNAWWGSFDLAVNLFSGEDATPPATDFIMRNAMDAQEVAVGWWPGDPRYPRAAFYAYTHPAEPRFQSGEVEPTAARWVAELGEFVLDHDDVVASPDPHATAVRFARTAFASACAACRWDPELAASGQGTPPPLR